MSMDISAATAPESDRLNADDFRMGPATVTVDQVTPGTTDKGRPTFHIHYREFPGRPLKPGKNVLRILGKGWGPDASQWPGRRATLYSDPDVSFGKEQTGGVRISQMSHLDAPFALKLQERRGKYKTYNVDPLPDSTPTAEVQPDWQAEIEARAGDVDALRALWSDAQARGASQAVLKDIKADATVATDNPENKED